jgi:hypothetical protein
MSKNLTSFLEEVEMERKHLDEGINPKQMSQMGELVDEMGFREFIMALKYMINTEDSPVKRPEEVAELLTDIINLEK